MIYNISDTHPNKMNSLEVKSDVRYISVLLKNEFVAYIVLSLYIHTMKAFNVGFIMNSRVLTHLSQCNVNARYATSYQNTSISEISGYIYPPFKTIQL